MLPYHKRFFCKSDSNKDLFYLDVFSPDEFTADIIARTNGNREVYLFNFSFEVDIEQQIPESKIFLEVIANPGTSALAREAAAKELFSLMKTKQEIQTGFFADYQLNKRGLYIEDYMNVLHDIVHHYSFRERQPISIHRQEFVFKEISKAFNEDRSNMELMPVSKNSFENEISLSPDLERAYLEIYVSSAEYFSCFFTNNGLAYHSYLMASGTNLLLFFIAEINPE